MTMHEAQIWQLYNPPTPSDGNYQQHGSHKKQPEARERWKEKQTKESELQGQTNKLEEQVEGKDVKENKDEESQLQEQETASGKRKKQVKEENNLQEEVNPGKLSVP